MTEKRDWLFRKLTSGELVKLDVDIFYKIYRDRLFYTKPGKGRNGRVSFVPVPSRRETAPIPLARFIMNTQCGEIADHIDRNVLDCRRRNLRNVNSRQSQLNRKLRNSTGFIGTSISYKAVGEKRYRYYHAKFLTESGKYRNFSARITRDNLVLCAIAHDKFVLEAGEEEYAPLNFPFYKEEPFRTRLLEADLRKFRSEEGGDLGAEIFREEQQCNV